MFIQELLDNFDESQYTNENNIKSINNFIFKYTEIEKYDIKKPIFSLTKKYHAYKLKKKENSKKKKVWKKLTNSNEDEKIKTEIKSNLNKISDEVHDSIIVEIKKILLKSNNIEILNYFMKILYDKIIHDIKFQSKYIDILEEIYKYDKLYLNYVEINSKDKKYTWNKLEGDKIYGPFNTKKQCIKNIKKKMNLYKLLIDIMNKENKKRDEYIKLYEEEEEDELQYKLKRKYIGVYEILRILYNKNKIPITLINKVLYDLFLYKNINYDIECLHSLIIKLQPNKDNFISSSILNSIMEKLNNIDKTKLKSRNKFLSFDIVDKFKEYLKLVD